MPRMYHPELDTAPGYNPIDVADDDGLVRSMKEAGWGTVIPPEAEPSAFAAEQPDATYKVVNPDESGKTRQVRKSTK